MTDSEQPMTDDSNQKFALHVVHQLRQAGYQAFWAGGCVRDLLLKKTPKDYDVATDALPDQVRDVFGRRKTLAIGEAFGVIAVLGAKGVEPVEIATFRSDAEYSDGRHPDSVEFSDPQEDAQRRDFTINGLFYDPIDERVIDYVEGQIDLEKKLIRAIGNPHDRFAEDKLRMLRAIRFTATYGFQIDDSTKVAIRENANELNVVSSERIAAETRRMLAHQSRKRSLELLIETNLFEEVFSDDDQFDPAKADSVLPVIDRLATNRFEPAFAVICLKILRFEFESATKERRKKLKRWLNDWKLTNDESQMVLWLLGSYSVVMNASVHTWPKVQRILVEPHASELIAFSKAVALNSTTTCSADAQSNSASMLGIEYCEKKLRLPFEELNPKPLLSGDDLMAIGMKPGPKFKLILEQVRDEQLMGRLKSSADAIGFAKSLNE